MTRESWGRGDVGDRPGREVDREECRLRRGVTTSRMNGGWVEYRDGKVYSCSRVSSGWRRRNRGHGCRDPRRSRRRVDRNRRDCYPWQRNHSGVSRIPSPTLHPAPSQSNGSFLPTPKNTLGNPRDWSVSTDKRNRLNRITVVGEPISPVQIPPDWTR